MQEHETIHVNYKTAKKDKEKISTTDYKIRELAGYWGKLPGSGYTTIRGEHFTFSYRFST